MRYGSVESGSGFRAITARRGSASRPTPRGGTRASCTAYPGEALASRPHSATLSSSALASGRTPAVAKAAAGALEYLAVAFVSGIPGALDRAKRAGVWCAGLDADAVKEFARQSLRSSKTPDLVAFADALPYTETGKLLRRVVQAELDGAS